MRFPAEQLILQRDLNEVLLLLDFISGRPDVHISYIGDIRYPVRQSTEANANNGNGVTSRPAALPPIKAAEALLLQRREVQRNRSVRRAIDVSNSPEQQKQSNSYTTILEFDQEATGSK